MDFVIAVDGSAASGKGTLAALLAADWPVEPLLVPHRVWALKAERPD